MQVGWRGYVGFVEGLHQVRGLEVVRWLIQIIDRQPGKGHVVRLVIRVHTGMTAQRACEDAHVHPRSFGLCPSEQYMQVEGTHPTAARLLR